MAKSTVHSNRDKSFLVLDDAAGVLHCSRIVKHLPQLQSKSQILSVWMSEDDSWSTEKG